MDLERQRPIDLLPDRSTETLTQWLKARSTIAIISRDRAQDYIKAATDGAPQAAQVADRWHLLQNLRDTVVRFLDRNRAYLKATIPPVDQGATLDVPSEATTLNKPQRHSLARRAQRVALYEKVRTLHQEGMSIRSIASSLQVGRDRVRKYVRASEFPEYPQRRKVPSKLDPFLSYLKARTDDGCYSGTQLYRELRALGYRGSRGLIARWLGEQTPSSPGPTTNGHRRRRPWASSRLAWLLVKKDTDLTPKEQEVLSRVLETDAKGATLYDLCQAFTTMVRTKKPDALAPWLSLPRSDRVSATAHWARSHPTSPQQDTDFANRIEMLRNLIFSESVMQAN